VLYQTLAWHGPFSLPVADFSTLPSKPGVYVFTESAAPIRPNPVLPSEDDPNYESAISRLRTMPCVLYVGKASVLSTRLPGYRFKPYLEIQRRPKGSPSRHEADRHKGRALVHAQQFFDGPVFLWWSETPSPEAVEATLIRELHPVLNTRGV
jgi:hypothetical protein